MDKNKHLLVLYNALSDLHAALQAGIDKREPGGKLELTAELVSANQQARLLVGERYRWLVESVNESAAMEVAEGGLRYVAREFQPSNMMFDLGMEAHCWILFDIEKQKNVEMPGVLEHVAKERAAEWNALHKIGHSKLEVEFEPTGDTQHGAPTYRVTVDGVGVGTLYREPDGGIRGAVRGGHHWEFAPSDAVEEAYKHGSGVLWFLPSLGWNSFEDAAATFQRAMDEPLNREDASSPWWVHQVHCFLRVILFANRSA